MNSATNSSNMNINANNTKTNTNASSPSPPLPTYSLPRPSFVGCVTRPSSPVPISPSFTSALAPAGTALDVAGPDLSNINPDADLYPENMSFSEMLDTIYYCGIDDELVFKREVALRNTGFMRRFYVLLNNYEMDKLSFDKMCMMHDVNSYRKINESKSSEFIALRNWCRKHPKFVKRLKEITPVVPPPFKLSRQRAFSVPRGGDMTDYMAMSSAWDAACDAARDALNVKDSSPV